MESGHKCTSLLFFNLLIFNIFKLNQVNSKDFCRTYRLLLYIVKANLLKDSFLINQRSDYHAEDPIAANGASAIY